MLQLHWQVQLFSYCLVSLSSTERLYCGICPLLQKAVNKNEFHAIILQSVVKLLNQRWWVPVFRRNCNMTGDMYTCVETFYACIRFHSLKYHIIKASNNKHTLCLKKNRKYDLVPWGACNGQMISACCSFNILVIR